MNEVIKLAIENGWYANIEVGEIEDGDGHGYEVKELAVLDPLFWQALGKALGWGNWSKPLEEIDHDWEVDHYQADTAKTPVYYCKKSCLTHKLGDVIYYDQHESGETTDIKYAGYNTIRASAHGIKWLKTWKEYAHQYFDLLLTGGNLEDFWKDLLKQ